MKVYLFFIIYSTLPKGNQTEEQYYYKVSQCIFQVEQFKSNKTKINDNKVIKNNNKNLQIGCS